MELREIWKKLETEKLEVVRATSLTEWPPKSKHPVRKLERAFLAGLVFVVIFELIFFYLFWVFQYPIVRFCLALVIFCYLLFFIWNYKVYRLIRKGIDFGGNLKETLNKIYHDVNASLKFQRKAALFIYPIASSAGFLIGFATQENPSVIMDNPWIIGVMVVTSVILTPAGYYLAKWMEKVSYGKYCDQLKQLIDEMKD